MNKVEKKKFGQLVKHEFDIIKKTAIYNDQEKACKIITLLDIVYLLGISVDEKYRWAGGFEKWQKELGINLTKPFKGISKGSVKNPEVRKKNEI